MKKTTWILAAAAIACTAKPARAEADSQYPAVVVPIPSRVSLINYPNNQKPSISDDGVDVARQFYEVLEKKDPATAAHVREVYRNLSGKQLFGNEYLAFSWFCEYILADEALRQNILKDPVTKQYYDFLSADDYKILKTYLRRVFWVEVPGEKKPEGSATAGQGQPEPVKKLRVLFGLSAPKKPAPSGQPGDKNQSDPRSLRGPLGAGGSDGGSADKKRSDPPPPTDGATDEEISFWRDFILFNNPLRPEWENTAEILKRCDIKPGEAIVDVGCGPGYYSMRFLDQVGDTGKVFAIDTNSMHLDFVRQLKEQRGAGNLEIIQSKFDDACLPEQSVDKAFVCSLYGVIYLVSTEDVKDRFIKSLKKALKPGGKLFVVDNNVSVPAGFVPYHGPRIEPSLVIAQLEHYGFKLKDRTQIIPQRYMLTFEFPGEKP